MRVDQKVAIIHECAGDAVHVVDQPGPALAPGALAADGPPSGYLLNRGLSQRRDGSLRRRASVHRRWDG